MKVTVLCASLLLPMATFASPLVIDSGRAGLIEKALATEDVRIATPSNVNDLIVASPIIWGSNHHLSLIANRNVILSGGGSIQNTAAGNVSILTDQASLGNGRLIIEGADDPVFLKNGTVNIAYYPVDGYGSNMKSTAKINPYQDWIHGKMKVAMQIDTAQDLQNINQNLAGTYVLGRSIDLANFAWATIGDMNTPFTGSLDGQGFVIDHLHLAGVKAYRLGLFGVLGKTGVLSNMTLSHLDLSGFNTVGGLVAVNQGHISRISVNGSIAGYNNVGGVVGANQGQISNVFSDVNIEVQSGFAGGVVGGNDELGTIEHSFAKAHIQADEADHIGAFAGDNMGVIETSYAEGEVTGIDNVGGFSGGNDGEMGKLINDGSATTVKASGMFVGGFSGDNVEGASIYNVYSIGLVSGAERVGGLVGYGSARVSGSYWDVDSSHQTRSGAGIPKSDAEMRDPQTYEGWDFDKIWVMDGYPKIRASV